MNNENETLTEAKKIIGYMSTSERLIQLLDIQGKIEMLEGEINLCAELMKQREKKGGFVTLKMNTNQERLTNTLRGFKNTFTVQLETLHKQNKE